MFPKLLISNSSPHAACSVQYSTHPGSLLMKNPLVLSFIALTIAALQTSQAATFFTEDFAHGSTLNQPPVNPTPTSTSYQVMSSKNWSPAPSVASADLKFGIAATTSGSIEIQALFTNSPVALVVEGDYVE